MARERGNPRGVGAGGELALRVDDGVQLHRDSRVKVGPPAIDTEHLDVQPEVPVDVRIECAGAKVLQLDDLDAGEVFPDEPVVPTARIELRLPREQDAVAEAVLQRFELGSEVRVQERGDAVRLGVVDRPVEKQIGVWAQPLMTALLPRDRVVPRDPDTQATGGELIAPDPAARDDEPGDGGIGCLGICLERFGTYGVRTVRVADAFKREAIACRTPRDSTLRFHRSSPPRMPPDRLVICHLSRYFSRMQASASRWP